MREIRLPDAAEKSQRQQHADPRRQLTVERSRHREQERRRANEEKDFRNARRYEGDRLVKLCRDDEDGAIERSGEGPVVRLPRNGKLMDGDGKRRHLRFVAIQLEVIADRGPARSENREDGDNDKEPARFDGLA